MPRLKDPKTGRFRKQGTYNNNLISGNSTLAEGIANFEVKTLDGIEQELSQFMRDLEEYARTNAPWNDRTGDARDGLRTDFVDTNRRQTMGISLYHTVTYGIWLEIRWGGRYAIILPSIENMGPKLMKRIERLLSEIVYYE